MSDHVHILAILPPKIAVSDALREIKANSSKWVHESRPELARFGWQDGYAAFTVDPATWALLGLGVALRRTGPAADDPAATAAAGALRSPVVD